MNLIFQNFIKTVSKIFTIYLITLLLFIAFRVAILVSFGDFNDLSAYKSDLFKAFWVGFKFDTSVIAYGLLPMLIFALVVTFVKKSEAKLYASFLKFLKLYTLFMCISFSLMLIADFYFFKFFQSHINMLAFGIIHDDTKAVLDSVWLEYPIIKIGIFIFILGFLWNWLMKAVISQEVKPFSNNKIVSISTMIVFVAIYLLAMRGSVGTFPLETDDTAISENTFVNSLTMNGVFAIKVALEEKQKQHLDTDIDKTLAKYDFKNQEEVLSTYLDTVLNNKVDLEQYLLSKTSSNPFLENNPPNVVFIQMESMSNYYIDFHSKEMNLLGTLETQLPYCYLFRNFLSCTNGTIHSLEGLMVNTPLTPISQSEYMTVPLKSSVAYPFKKQGYETNFITGAKLGWRNLDKFVPKQYFDNCEGSATLLSKNPKAQACEWGTYDEFLFDRMFEVLNKKSKKPKFIFAMTTTNHTPFELPSTYKPHQLNVPASLKSQFKVDASIAQKNFTNYQYANDCLGRFIEKIRNSPIGKNTIVVASGDHNTLQVFDFNDAKMLQKLSVPLVMYVPEQYKPKWNIDTTRFGSHKDIFPTIFNLALSNAKYVKSGNDLLSKNQNIHYFGVNNYKVAMDKNGCVFLEDKPMYFTWQMKNKKYLEPNNATNKSLNILIKKANSHIVSLDLYIQTQLLKAKN